MHELWQGLSETQTAVIGFDYLFSIFLLIYTIELQWLEHLWDHEN